MSSKRHKAFVIAVLGVLLSVAFVSPAMAEELEPSFTVSSQQVVVGESVTVTDTTSNPDGYELTYEWETSTSSPGGVDMPDVKAGSPECLNEDCSKARWTYGAPGDYRIDGWVRWSDGNGLSSQRVLVIPANEVSAPIIMNGPTSVASPTVLSVASPKRYMIARCSLPAFQGSEWESCWAYLAKRVGPDANGFYYFRFRLPVVYPGTVNLTFIAWNDDPEYADSQSFTVDVTANEYRFGDVRSCYWPKVLKWDGTPRIRENHPRPDTPIRHAYDLDYYATMNTWVAVKLQVRRGTRWVTRKVKRVKFNEIHLKINSPWIRRHLRVQLVPARTLGRNRRAIYEIRHGRKLLKRGNLWKRRCTQPLAS